MPTRLLPSVLAIALVMARAVVAQPVEREPAPLITNVQGRSVTRLDGRWQTIIDPFENGYYDYRWQPTPNGYFKVRRPSNGTDLVEYDFDRSPLLAVPGDWNSQRTDLLWYEGTVWYRTTFARAPRADRRLWVHFGAANHEARVWLNGAELGVHRGGFTPFDFEITALVREGRNDLVVKVDNRRRREAVPTLNADWWNYGGITRSVTLVETPRVFVRDYVLQLDPRDARRVRGWVQVDGPAGASLATPVTVRIPGARLSTTVTPGADGRAAVTMDAARLARWSPERPTLHDVEVATADETIRDRIGFRTIAVRGHEILLNGAPVFLRGISMHEEAPFDGRRSFGADDARTLLGWVRELGGNFVRLAHYPHDEATVRMADSLGLMVWAEIPVYWTIQWENPSTQASALQQLTELVTRDRNRAAVVLWSVANETPRDTNAAGTGPRLAFLRALVDRARSLDSTRLLTAALEHRYLDDSTITIDDPLGAALDVLGNNEYVGWYDMPLSKADRLRWTSAYDKPLVMSEWGGDAKQGLHGSADSIWTEEYQQRLYERQIAMLRRIPSLAGTSPWILKDFRSPRRPLPGIQDYFNRKGLISDRGERKLAFYTLQAWYRELARSVGDGRSREER